MKIDRELSLLIVLSITAFQRKTKDRSIIDILEAWLYAGEKTYSTAC